MKKPVFYTELTYLFGIIVLALGATTLVKANFGVSVVVAPAYLIHLKLSQFWSFVTFGVAEYIMQGVLLMVLCLVVRRFHWSYLLSFATTLVYGRVLDLCMFLMAGLDVSVLWLRLVFFILGLPLCALGVSLILHTYLAPEVYELLLKECAAKFQLKVAKLKMAYDCTSCSLAILLSFAFFGLFQFVGVNIGTVVCALANGRIIAVYNKFLETHFDLRPAFPTLQRFFAPPPFPRKIKPDEMRDA